MKKISKTLVLLQVFLYGLPAHAQLMSNDGKNSITGNMEDTGREANFATNGGNSGNFLLSSAAEIIVSAFLGILGIIFLIMILIGGWTWMTAAGNPENASKGRTTIIRGIVGLAIIVTAYIITAFVFRALGGVMSGVAS